MSARMLAAAQQRAHVWQVTGDEGHGSAMPRVLAAGRAACAQRERPVPILPLSS